MKESKEKIDTIEVLLRNRPFYGAQLTLLPALYYLSKKFEGMPLSLYSRYDLGWFYDQCPWVEGFTQTNNLLSDLRVIPKNCHALISFQPSSERALLIKALKRPKNSAGFTKGSILFKLDWDHSICFDPSEYRALHYLRLVKNMFNDVDYNSHIKEMADPFKYLSSCSNHNNQKTSTKTRFSILPGGGAGEFKKWGIDNFLSLCEKIKNHTSGATFDVILGPDEKGELEYLKSENLPYINIHYSLPLKDLSKTIEQASVVISNDCGPSHIAQCLGKPYLGIYDKEKPEWVWTRRMSKVITPESKHDAITSISVDKVESQLLDLLSECDKASGDQPPNSY